MVQQLTRFSIIQTSKVAGVTYALLGVLFGAGFFVASLVSPNLGGYGLGFAILLPILYGSCGFVITAISCAIYNWVAGMVGGIEVQWDSPKS